MRGRWRIDFALFPHAGDWLEGSVPAAAEAYRHAFVTAPGAALADAAWPPEHAGDDALRLEGDGVTLSSLRRRDEGWLEARIVNLAADARSVRVLDEIEEARMADLRGLPGAGLDIGSDGVLHLQLGPAEIRTIQLRRRESAVVQADFLDAAGPRQNA
jgi:alpha-mannosidase